MKKNYGSSFHYLLKYYNKCVRKYQRLKIENASSNRLSFLLKRIEQTLSKILVFIPRLKKQVSLAILAGSFFLISHNSNGQITFGPQQVNPFGLTQEIRVNGYSSHMSQSVFVDIDNDGDLDIIENKWGFGANNGENKFYENIGNATAPNFSSAQVNPFSIQPGQFECIAFVDLDNDGDLDLFTLETSVSAFKYYENIGSASNPNFAAPINNPFGISTSQSLNSPAFADFDNDGDFDLMFFGYGQDVSYFENTGTASSPSFAAEVADPFGIVVPGTHFYNRIAIADIDNDGDYDIMSGSGYMGDLTFFENIGSASTPNFTSSVVNPFGISLTNEEATTCSFGDIDNDGDLDILTQNQTQISGAERKRDFIIFENTSPSTASISEINADINTYPNPVEDVLNISVDENSSLSLLNVNGEEVKTFDVKAGNNQFDISDLPSGVYLIKGDKGLSTKKIVKN